MALKWISKDRVLCRSIFQLNFFQKKNSKKSTKKGSSSISIPRFLDFNEHKTNLTLFQGCHKVPKRSAKTVKWPVQIPMKSTMFKKVCCKVRGRNVNFYLCTEWKSKVSSIKITISNSWSKISLTLFLQL